VSCTRPITTDCNTYTWTYVYTEREDMNIVDARAEENGQWE
jgi:hypothetical protein